MKSTSGTDFHFVVLSQQLPLKVDDNKKLYYGLVISIIYFHLSGLPQYQ